MKQKLLVLGAFLMASVSLSAQSYTANRTKLVPEFTTWAMEDTCYLWNVGSQGFFCNHQGLNADPYWHTRAIACDTLGHKVVFTRNNPSGTEEPWESDGVSDNTCLLVSWVGPIRWSKYMCTFADGWNGIWTDNDGNAYRYFNVIPKGNLINIERNMMLAQGTEEHEGKYIGVLAGDHDKTLKLHDTEQYFDDNENPYYNVDPSAEFWEDWAIVSPDAYDAWVAAGGKEMGKAVAAAESLKSALEKAYADNPGINLDAPLAVYNNEASTAEELSEAEASIPALVVEFLKNKDVDVNNPIDFTSSIVNSTFDTIGDFTGWSFGEGTKQFGAGGTTSTCAEVWRGSFDGYQVLSGLPEGVYMLACNGYCRYNDSHVDDYNYWKAGNLSRTKLYMTSETAGTFSTTLKNLSEGGSLDAGIGGAGNNVTATIEEDGYEYEALLYTPNSMLEANAYFHDEETPGRYHNEVFGALADGETLRIGVTNPVTTDWSVFDDFQLFYFGAKPEAYQFWGNKVAETSNISFDEVYYGAPDKEAYETALNNLRNASTKEDVINNIAALNEATEKVVASKVNYAAFVAKYEEAMQWLLDAEDEGITGDDVLRLADYLQISADDDSGDEFPNGHVNSFLDLEYGEFEGKLSGEQIAEETQYLTELINTAIRTGLVPGSVLTRLIVNPGFEDPMSGSTANGWSLDTHNGSTTSGLTNWRGGNASNYCAEAFMQKFDVYQIINDVPNGLYEVSVQAYYRDGSNEDAWNKYLNGETVVPTYVYFNEFATPVRNVMEITFDENLAENCAEHVDDEGNTVYTLDGMNSASAAFSLEDESKNFTMKVYGLVTDGTIRLGIRNLEQDGDRTWSLWDNFKLVYRGKDVEALTEVIENFLLRAGEMDLTECGSPEATALSEAMEAAESASGGDAMMDALLELVEAMNTAEKSIALYQEASQLLYDLSDAINEYSDASSEAKQNAETVNDNYTTSVSNYTLSVEELEKAIEDIKSAISKLKIPDTSGASDETPVDMTSLIVNPSYDDGTADGWSSPRQGGGQSRDDMNERYYASFDHNQTLKGLPAGTYELTLNCFNRIPGNNAQQDLNTFEEGRKSEVSTAFVYAKVGDQTYAEPFRMVSEGAREEWTLDGNHTTSTSSLTGKVLYCPDSMVAAGACFEEMGWDDDLGDEVPLSDEMNYLVRVVFTLTEQGDVTIGCMNSSDQTWCCWDNWTLTYFGTESEKQDSGDATAVESIENNASVVATEIYNVGGARIEKMQRGLNIVKMSDGSFRKVFVK